MPPEIEGTGTEKRSGLILNMTYGEAGMPLMDIQKQRLYNRFWHYGKVENMVASLRYRTENINMFWKGKGIHYALNRYASYLLRRNLSVVKDYLATMVEDTFPNQDSNNAEYNEYRKSKPFL